MSLFYRQNAAAVSVRICHGHTLSWQSTQSGSCSLSAAHGGVRPGDPNVADAFCSLEETRR